MSEPNALETDGRAKVLIVEDESRYAEAYRRMLDDEYDVVIATNGEEGITELDDSIDVVLLDRQLPQMSGEDVLDYMTNEDLDCQVAIVSAVEPDFDIVEMESHTYLSKPVDETELRTTVDDLLNIGDDDNTRKRFYSLIEKKKTLEATKSGKELQNSEEFEELNTKIKELRKDLGIIHRVTILKLSLFLVWWFSGIGVGTAFMAPDVVGSQISTDLFIVIMLAHFCSFLLIISLVPGPSDLMNRGVQEDTTVSEI